MGVEFLARINQRLEFYLLWHFEVLAKTIEFVLLEMTSVTDAE